MPDQFDDGKTTLKDTVFINSSKFTDRGDCVPFGCVGYKFRKYFPGHGYFTGEVIEIRPGAEHGKDRRCLYCDGDLEDLSLSELRHLHRFNSSPSGSGKSLCKSKNANLKNIEIIEIEPEDCKPAHQLRRSKRPRNECRVDSCDQSEKFSIWKSTNQNENPFSSIDQLIPIDMAAESTLDKEIGLTNDRNRCSSTATVQSCKSSDDEDNDLDIWLENIACLLGASSRSKQSTKVASLSSDQTSRSSISYARLLSDNSDSQSGDTRVHRVENSKNLEEKLKTRSSPEDIIKPLADIPYGARHGLKIFNKDDKNPVVGEVILEHRSGWIETIINGSLRKARVNKFFTVPTKYNIGDSICKYDLYQSQHTNSSLSCLRSRTNIGSHEDKNWKESNCGEYDCSTSTKPHISNQTQHQELNHRSLQKNTSVLTTECLFYWCCDACTLTNNYLVTHCSVCNTERQQSCKVSALLDIAETAIITASTIDEAVNMIPEMHMPAIPRNIISNLFHFHHKNSERCTYSVDIKHDIGSFFYWICSDCTMKNFFKKTKCAACTRKRDSSCHFSALLKIALESASNARNSDEAKELLSLEHRLAIPTCVLDSLVTCVATVGKNKNRRRCLRPKAPGMDFCTFHCDPHLSESNLVIKKSIEKTGTEDLHSFTKTRCRSIHETNPGNNNIYTMQNTIADFFENQVDPTHINELRWNILSIEDAILAQNNVPFPLGLLVRRFFPGFGFHDGRIIQTKRKQVVDDEKGIRPVLIYKVIYNDGDTEELLHHEINSLRQIYDLCNVKATAPSQFQIPTGTSYEVQMQASVTIVENRLRSTFVTNKGSDTIQVNVSTVGKPMSNIDLELTKLQLIVVRKNQDANNPDSVSNKVFTQNESVDKMQCLTCNQEAHDQKTPVFEWPLHAKKTFLDNESYTDQLSDQTNFELSQGLWVNLKPRQVASSNADDGKKLPISMTCYETVYNDIESTRPGLSVSQTGWDPAGGLDFVEWDPFQRVSCEVCGIDKDDHLILLCDRCHRGYHMYCVRPVIVNVPTNDWLCNECTPFEQNEKSYNDIVDEVQKNPRTICDFFRLPFDDPGEFCHLNKESLSLFLPSTHASKRFAVLGSLKSRSTVKIGSLYLTNKTNKNNWSLPLPLVRPSSYTLSLATILAAMRFCGMEKYSEDLIYPIGSGISKKMNDSSLEWIEPLSQRNVDIFNEFKENLKHGSFPPLQVVYDNLLGFSVEALAVIPKHTLIAEYAGQVTTVERSGETSSDSLMVLLDTGSPNTSLLIDPTKAGNIARFLNGINNRSQFSRRKANVRTRRFSLDGQCRVVLFTAKRIEPGDTLYYDYNAGVEGKSAGEWAKTGFYDTSNFL